MNKKFKTAVSLSLIAVLGASTASVFAGCTKGQKDAVTIMTEQLNGLFNPFYSTSGTDMDVVGMTQIGMLSTNEEGKPAFGNDEATVVLDYDITPVNGNSVYRFVLKNNLVFSDGYALTMNDVLFNMYEYLDPVYTGSSTMYSTKIVGLQTYRQQKNLSGGNDKDDTAEEAGKLADSRRQEIIDIYSDANLHYNPTSSANSYNVSEKQMTDYIKDSSLLSEISLGYTDAVTDNKNGANDLAYYRSRILADYERVCKLFKEELTLDYDSAQDAFDLTQAPYKKWADADHFNNPVFKFFYFEGMITPIYAKGQDNTDDKTNIERFDNESIVGTHSTKEDAINYLYNYYVQQQFSRVMSGFSTSNTIMTEFAAEARDVLLHRDVTDTLEYPNISGIRSIGHTGDESTVTVNGTTYTVAKNHDENYSDGLNKNYGAVADKNTYDILEIKVEGTDPKAIYNFGFSVAPAHYYTADGENPNGRKIDIKNNEFGVPWASFEFQSKTIQSEQHVAIPVGAGPFVATDTDNNDNPSANGFMNSNIGYYKRNENFSCLGDKFAVKAEKLRFQVLSSNNALDNLERGSVDYVTPQYTHENSERLKALEAKGFTNLRGWQLGYGYIGINAGKVPNIHVRRAIMAAMQAELACQFYEAGTCVPIDWPMSQVGWAYPTGGNGKTYLQWNETDANIKDQSYKNTIAKIKEEMRLAREEPEGVGNLNIKFTIAGATITEHPTYNVFKQAADILNKSDEGFNVEVVADSQALTKLATASLAVWAAAWGSTIDPDMYQVYSPYSTASSPKTWGYEQILADSKTYSLEYDILMREGGLADLIDEGRTIDVDTRRKEIYKEAMGLVLDLAVEMPVYQRQSVYVYNSNTIKGFSDCLIKEGKDKGLVNPYSSPLGRIWEIELVK